MMKKILLAITSLFITAYLFAQDGDVRMADAMRSEGKIYVVAAVVLAILAGLIIYLIRLDRKMTKLEKENRKINS